MNSLKRLWLGGLCILQQACGLPRTAALALKHSRRQAVLNALEAERLDRIRNPSKYLGKS